MGMVIDVPRRRLRKFPVNHGGDEIITGIDENVLHAHVHIVEVKRPSAALENLHVAHDISKDERAEGGKLVTRRAGTLPLEVFRVI